MKVTSNSPLFHTHTHTIVPLVCDSVESSHKVYLFTVAYEKGRNTG